MFLESYSNKFPNTNHFAIIEEKNSLNVWSSDDLTLLPEVGEGYRMRTFVLLLLSICISNKEEEEENRIPCFFFCKLSTNKAVPRLESEGRRGHKVRDHSFGGVYPFDLCWFFLCRWKSQRIAQKSLKQNFKRHFDDDTTSKKCSKSLSHLLAISLFALHCFVLKQFSQSHIILRVINFHKT